MCCILVYRTYLEGKVLNILQATFDGETSFVCAVNKTYINENISPSGHFYCTIDSLRCERHMNFT